MAKSTPLQQLQDQSDLSDSRMGKALTATPVVMAVIATLLAGLASSEMTKAQYERAYAAQLQSRAGDQWAFFQAKRLRGEMQRNTLDLLRQPVGDGAEVPELPPAVVLTPEVKDALEAVRADVASEELNPVLLRVGDGPLASALKAAKERSIAYDTLTSPLLKNLERAGTEGVATRLAFNASRYDQEAKLNADIARLYELQVRKTNLSAERHHLRSQRFFFGMLAAQAAVIVATLALAARKRNLLWGLAAGAGALAVVFAVYVYLYV